MTIGTRVLSGYVVVLALSTLASAGGVWAITEARDAYSEFIDKDSAMHQRAISLSMHAQLQSSAFRGYLLYRDPAMLDAWKGAIQDFDRDLAGLGKMVDDPADTSTLGEIETGARLWRDLQEKQLQTVNSEAAGVGPPVGELDDQRTNASDAIRTQVETFIAHRTSELADSRKHLEEAIAQVVTLLLILAAAALVTGLATSIWTTRSVSRALRDVIGRLASSTAEISAMTRQVASSAAETAAAVSETTSTVEEVKQTASVSASKARSVSQIAQRSVEISDGGQKAADDSLHGMQAIRKQMDTIAQCVIRLSEQGQAIGEIIATVNDLADQTNLLAVNASIEAARAGEYGRGFGVVAQEVKSLADQSKLATAQVRTILGEVQRATGSAVMAAEQGNKAVDAGVQQAGTVGAAIQQLAASIADSALSAAQIAASSQQQLAGMDQVALAMENISQASKQNAAGTGQAQSAAEDLKLLAERLRLLIEKGTPATAVH
ncbi:MAG: CHASE3 domain-containing protein [Candidatus Hydrogenedentes bacterium]|nr:CHASE3 domain-containing protein [Candidatus Hydrogenedentota bacterium]